MLKGGCHEIEMLTPVVQPCLVRCLLSIGVVHFETLQRLTDLDLRIRFVGADHRLLVLVSDRAASAAIRHLQTLPLAII